MMGEHGNPLVRGLLVTAGALVLLVGIAGGVFIVSSEKEAPADSAKTVSRPALSREAGRSFRIRTGDPDSPVISFQSARLVKRKLGPFAIAAYNILEVNDLEIAFSSVESERDGEETTDRPFISQESPFLGGGWKDVRKSFGADERISGVMVNHFSFAVRNGGQMSCILRAERADGRIDGALQLKSCFFLDEQTRACESPQGVLQLKDPVTLMAGGRQVVIRDVIKAFRKRELHAAGSQPAGDCDGRNGIPGLKTQKESVN